MLYNFNILTHTIQSLNFSRLNQSEFQKSLKMYDIEMGKVAKYAEFLAKKPYKEISGGGFIFYGAPGIGKTYLCEKVMTEYQKAHPKFKWCSVDTVSENGIYAAAFMCRHGGICIFDDCDKAFMDEKCCNALKHITDDKDPVVIRLNPMVWPPLMSGTDVDQALLEYQESPIDFNKISNNQLPQSFMYEGSCICCSNKDISQIHNEHMGALKSRLTPIPLHLSNKDKVYKLIDIMMGSDPYYLSTPLMKRLSKKCVQYIIDNFSAFETDDMTFRIGKEMVKLMAVYNEDMEMFDMQMRQNTALNFNNLGV